jgi:hypothetical protein
MSSILSKLLESENLDTIFQPFSRDELVKKVMNRIKDHQEWLEIGPTLASDEYGYDPRRFTTEWEEDLKNLDFSGINLEEAVFETEAHLEGCNFTGTNLKNARMIGCHVDKANFSKANLQGIGLTSSIAKGANFSEANLRKAGLDGLVVDGANFDGADLTGAIRGTKDASIPGWVLRGSFLEREEGK